MNHLASLFAAQRNIFGLSPCCTELFRLSDCRIYLRAKPKRDWKDRFDALSSQLEEFEQSISDGEQGRREEARALGRRLAQRDIKKIDKIFAPLKLCADDAKVIFHPIDYVVFKGLCGKAVTSIHLIDRLTTDRDKRVLQRSIEKVIARDQYEWITHRI